MGEPVTTVEELERMGELGLVDGGPLAITVDPGHEHRRGSGLGLATETGSRSLATADPGPVIAAIEQRWAPRWIWWDRRTPDLLATESIAVSRCWDVLAVHRLLFGGFRATLAEVWANLNDLDLDSIPTMGQQNLLDQRADEGDRDDPVQPDGHLRPEWLDGGWHGSPARLARWAALTIDAAAIQHRMIEQRSDPVRTLSTAHSESVAELLCAELAHHGLPIDEDEATRIITEAAGPRPRSRSDEEAEQTRRDADVLRHLDPRQRVNLRNPGEVKSMLARNGFDLPDTRAWRLEKLRDTEPLIDALLTWRKAERIATTYGWSWLDANVAGGRLLGSWSSSDGAAGRMTASAGLHNLPAPMRPAVKAEADHHFIRADLGQIEPRVLAAVSGDQALIAATADDDLYQPVARRLGVEREVAKVAVLGAMYGATTGESAGALRGLQQNYPVAMALLEDAAEQGRLGHDIFTIGGRRVRTGSASSRRVEGSTSSAPPGSRRRFAGGETRGELLRSEHSPDGDIDRAIAAAAGRGRYARNALIQGAAAEFFKMWAVIVRRRVRELEARVVLCLHDELLIHAPTANAETAAAVVAEAVAEAAFYWSPEPEVRFLAETTIIDRWSEAKNPLPESDGG